jgi:hypothetical protein
MMKRETTGGQMRRPGLYFPFIHVRDDDWLKTAALYWPSIRRLVPRPYPKHDSLTARTFFDAGILRDEVPKRLLDSMAWDLLDTIKQNADRLVADYSIGRAFTEWDGREWSECSEEGRAQQLGWIHVTKFPRDVADYLVERDLAHRGRGTPDDPWVGLHPVLAGAYMTALAGRISEQAYLEPLTDQTDLRIATPNDNVQSAISLLLGRMPAEPGTADISALSGTETYVMLALKYARPKDPSAIDARKIVQCRENLREELESFWHYVDGQRAELTELASIPLQTRRLEAFVEHVEQTIEQPLRRLEKGLKLHKLEPARSLLLAGSVAPPLAASATLSVLGAPPVATTATGAVAAVGTAWWQIENTRRQSIASSPVGYLLDVRDQLTPKTLTGRVRKILQGTYG